MKTKTLTIDGDKFKLVKTEITGCSDCCFNTDDVRCLIAGDHCFKSVHKNEYPMAWKPKQANNQPNQKLK